MPAPTLFKEWVETLLSPDSYTNHIQADSQLSNLSCSSCLLSVQYVLSAITCGEMVPS